ncbi:MAG: TlpA family protein disulfide reductase [Anaerolineaceae bacterium]|nr:TlpA family protein disulfide reductase [Anaerolineaceae bacterium]
MKKAIFLTVIVILLLCACGSNQKAAQTSEPAADPTEVPAPAAAGAAEENAGKEEMTAYQEVYNAFTELEKIGERMNSSKAYIVLDTAGKSIWKVPLAGLEFQVPDFIKEARGGIRARNGSESIPGTGIVSMDAVYFSMTEAEYYDLTKKIADYTDDTEDIDEIFGVSKRYMETVRQLNVHRHPLFSIMGIGNNGGPEDILAAERKENLLGGYMTEEEMDAEPDKRIFTKIGSAEDYNFFFVQEPMDEQELADAAADGEEYKTEYEMLFNAKDQIIPNFTFSRPIGVKDMVAEGTGLSFETLDIHGNPVKSGDIFSGHKVTMLNIWATTCTACISEMPELMRLNKEFEAKGGQIVGLVFDAVEDDLITEAREITEELNIDFLTLLPNDYLRKTFDAISYPTTYFVNEKGEIMGEPLMGAKISAYQERMAEYLDN